MICRSIQKSQPDLHSTHIRKISHTQYFKFSKTQLILLSRLAYGLGYNISRGLYPDLSNQWLKENYKNVVERPVFDQVTQPVFDLLNTFVDLLNTYTKPPYYHHVTDVFSIFDFTMLMIFLQFI